MALKFRCVCGRKLSAPESAVGRRGRCPECGDIFVVPSAQALEPEPIKFAAADAPEPQYSAAGGVSGDGGDPDFERGEIPLAAPATAEPRPFRTSGTVFPQPVKP